ncbi:MAG: 5-bromo-4-chloroindolyl phosphate hydrolysis family protein [Clostridia bacterium]|nr:5-bromo-4-chloroindolyl phosphate hydrolysis family protein [Clostridia bacterium]
MKNSSVISAIIGGTFFAVPYLALSVGVLPSLAIGACAFGAGELILRDKETTTLKDKNRSLYDTLMDAKKQNNQIEKMVSQIEDEKMRKDIKEITDSANKIISTVENNPKKAKNMNNFFNYYLPVTLNILKRYDEIENQRLATEEGKEFMTQTQDMIEKINGAFKTQLSNLYSSDMIDTDAEMKVFESMLKADGYDETSDFKKINRREKQSE